MSSRPVLFIHGLWLHATSWQPWEELFAERGYAPSAPGWPGEPATVAEARDNPEAIADHGIDEVTSHYAKIIADMPQPPVLVGHSFGGMIVEKLLGENSGAAGIAIDAAQIKGVLPLPLSSLRATLPVFKNPANKHRAVSLTADQFHYAFGNAISREESDRLYDAWTIPAPGPPLFEAAGSVRGGGLELQPALPGEGAHRQHRPGSTAAHDGRPGPHRARGDHQVDPASVPALHRGHRHHRIPRSGPFLDD